MSEDESIRESEPIKNHQEHISHQDRLSTNNDTRLLDSDADRPDVPDKTGVTLRCPVDGCDKEYTKESGLKAFRSLFGHCLKAHGVRLSKEDFGLGIEEPAPTRGEERYQPEVEETQDYRIRTKRERQVKDFYKARRDKENEIVRYVRDHPEVLDELGVRRRDFYGMERERGRIGPISDISIAEYFDTKKERLEARSRWGNDQSSKVDIQSQRRIQELESELKDLKQKDMFRDLIRAEIDPIRTELESFKDKIFTKSEDIQKMLFLRSWGQDATDRFTNIFELEEAPRRRKRGEPSSVVDLLPPEYVEG